jgi:hypothetical protein
MSNADSIRLFPDDATAGETITETADTGGEVDAGGFDAGDEVDATLTDTTDDGSADQPGESDNEATTTTADPVAEDTIDVGSFTKDFAAFREWQANQAKATPATAPAQVAQPAATDLKTLEADTQKTVAGVAVNLAKVFGYGENEKEIIDGLTAALAPLAAPSLEVAKFKAELSQAQQSATQTARATAVNSFIDTNAAKWGVAAAFGTAANASTEQRAIREAFDEIAQDINARQVAALVKAGKPVKVNDDAIGQATVTLMKELGLIKPDGSAAPTTANTKPKPIAHPASNGVKGLTRPKVAEKTEEELKAEIFAKYAKQ